MFATCPQIRQDHSRGKHDELRRGTTNGGQRCDATLACARGPKRGTAGAEQVVTARDNRPSGRFGVEQSSTVRPRTTTRRSCFSRVCAGRLGPNRVLCRCAVGRSRDALANIQPPARARHGGNPGGDSAAASNRPQLLEDWCSRTGGRSAVPRAHHGRLCAALESSSGADLRMTKLPRAARRHPRRLWRR